MGRTILSTTLAGVVIVASAAQAQSGNRAHIGGRAPSNNNHGNLVGPNPFQPQRPSNNGDLGRAILPLVPGIINGLNNNRPQNNWPSRPDRPNNRRPNYRPDSDDQYDDTPQNTPQYAPQNDVPDATPPVNEVPANEVPADVTALPNDGLMLADANTINDLQKQSDQEMSDSLDKINDKLSNVFTDQTRDEYAKHIEDLRDKLPPDKRHLIDEAKDALNQGDSATLKEKLDEIAASKPGGLLKGWRDTLVGEVDVKAKLDKVNDARNSNASPEDVLKATQDLQSSIQKNSDKLPLSPLDKQQLQNAAQSANSAATLGKVVADLQNNPSNGTIPTGPIWIINGGSLQGLQPGQVIVVGPDSVVVVSDADDWTLVQGSAEDAVGGAVVDSDPIPDSEVAPPAAGSAGIVNPISTRGPVSFIAGGQTQTLPAGFQLEFAPGTVIEFDRGKGNGNAQYTLADGVYEFAASANGWDLHAKQYEATIDNSNNSKDFNYLVDNQTQMCPARGTKVHTAGRPIRITFDQGRGAKTATKELANGVYSVAFDAQTGLLDLFPEKTVANRPKGTSQGVATNRPTPFPIGARPNAAPAPVPARGP